MTPYQQEQLEVLRRIAERGKGLCERCIARWDDDLNYRSMLDLFVRMLDELERLKCSATTTSKPEAAPR